MSQRAGEGKRYHIAAALALAAVATAAYGSLGKLPPPGLQRQMEAFVQTLYAHLGAECFLHGAFVLGVPKGSAFEKFVAGAIAASSRRPAFARTHRAFMRKFPGGDKHQAEFLLNPPMVIKCNDKSLKKGAVLMYRFRARGALYLYLKLESYAAVSARHAVQAAVYYSGKLRDGRGEDRPFEGRRRVTPYDKHVRVGNEVHVPGRIAAEIFDRSAGDIS